MKQPGQNTAAPTCSRVVAAAAALLAVLPAAGFAQDRSAEVVRPFLWHAQLPRSPENVVNIFRRFDATLREPMVEFYADVLGIQPLPYTANAMMIRFPVGTSELKLFPTATANELRMRPVREVAGVRLMTLFFPDEAVLSARFSRHGYAAPAFVADGARRIAHVQDPDGQWVELVVVAGAAEAVYAQVEYGLTVTDIERSRAYYRDFVGLEELPAVHHPLLRTAKHSYRHGDQVISLWSFGAELPKDTSSAGIQYVVWNVEGVDALANARRMPVDRPLSAAGRFPRTVWLFDPDGITNYFAQFHATPEAIGSAD